jgi:hypothetical protein
MDLELFIVWAEKFRELKRPMSIKELTEVAERAGFGYDFPFVFPLF